MKGLLIEVQTCYPAEANMHGVSDEVVATGIIYSCLYEDLRLQGPANVRLGAERDTLNPSMLRLHVEVALGITGIDERDLPTVEAVAERVARYVTLALCDVVHSVEAVRVTYATLSGAWDVYLPFAALATAALAPA